MKQEQPRPLDRVLLRLLLLRLVLPSLLVILLTVWLVGYLVTHNLGTQQLQLARSLAYTVDDYLEHASRVVGAVAQAAQSAAAEELALYMQATQRAYGYFDTLYQLDESGHVTVLAPPDPRYQGLDLSRQPYFGQARAKTGVTISQPFISLRTGQPAVYMAQPLADGSLVVGELNLGALQEAIAAALGEPGRNTIFVADRSGTLLAHPRSDLVAQQANVGHLDVVQRGLTGQATSFYSTDGTLVLGSAAPVERAGWVIVAQVPLAVAYGPYIRVTTPLVLFAPVVWLALIWSIRQRLSHHVVAPLARLSQGADALAAGDFAQGAALAAIPVAFAEVGALATDFERMGQAIQARQAALQESEERYRRLVDNAPDVIFRWSIEKGLEYISPIASEVTGYTPEELMADPMLGFKIATGNDPQLAMDYQRIITEGTALPSKEYLYARKDGGQVYLDVRSVAIRDDQGNVIALEGILRDITERKRAEERVQRLLNQQIAVNRLALALGEFRDLDKIYHTIYEYVQALMDAEAFIVSFYDDETQLLHAGYVVSEGTVRDAASLSPIPLEEVGYGTQSQVIHTGQPFYVPDLRKAMERTKTEHSITENGTVSEGPPSPEEQDISRSSLYVPMKIEGETIGVIQVQSFRLDAYSQEDIDLLSALANVAAIAIQNVRLYDETHSRAERLAVVNRIARAASASLHLDDLMETVYQEIAPLFQTDAFFIALYDGETNELDFRIRVDEGIREHPERQPMGSGLTGLIVAEKRPLLIRNFEEEQGRLPQPARLWGTMKISASWLGVPMLIGDRVVGVISVQAYRPHAYGEEEQLLLSTIADQVAVAVENARLFEAQQAARERTDTLREISRAVGSTLELDDVLSLVLRQAKRVLAYDTASVLLFAGGEPAMAAVNGYEDEELVKVEVSLRLGDSPILQAMARDHRSVVIADVREDERWIWVPGTKDTRAWIGAPLLVRDEMIGALMIDSTQPGSYTEADAAIAQALANQAAVAIENARLYQAEQRGREVAEALQETARVVNASLNLDKVLLLILEQLAQVIEYDSSAVLLLDDGRFKVTAGRGFSDLEAALRLSFSAAEDNLASAVMRARRPLIIEDVQSDPRWQPDPRVTHMHGWIGAPLIVRDRVIGVLTADSRRPGAYSEEDGQLLFAFANQATIAIQNAQLYEEAQHRLESLTNLNRASRVVTSSLDVKEILEQIVELTGSVVNSDHTSVMLLDEDEQPMLEAGDFRGIPPVAQRIRSSGITRHVLASGQPAVVDTISDAGAMSPPLRQPDGELMKANPDIVAAGIRSFAAVPIQAKGRALGVLFVHSRQPRAFHGQLSLLTTFANQAAVAIENAWLYQELRDHAGQLEQRVQERTAQLQAQYARLDAILRSASDGIIVADGQGEIIQANPVAQTWLTRTLSPEDAAWLREAVRSLAQEAGAETAPGKWPELVLELTGLDLELKAAPISEPGLEEAAAVVAVHDVSHLKALNRIKSRFITNISHELRTPITTIKLYAALMQQTSPEEEKWEQYVDALAQEADHQARLVEGILQISRIDAGRLEMKPRPICLNELTGVAIASHQVLAQDQGLILEHRPAEPGSVTLVDPERMMQVLSNLVGNAIRYTPAGGKVVVSTGKEESEERIWATVTVADTGMGIPEEELPHVFERFFRGEKPRKMQISGTGLGLAIVREIVELHGGRVTVESEVGVGTTFTIWLPLADAQV